MTFPVVVPDTLVLCHYIADTQGVHVVHFQPHPGTENTFCHFHLDAHISQFPIKWEPHRNGTLRTQSYEFLAFKRP